MSPSYAVVIPAYNASRTLAETIRSVLAQTVPPAEVVVVDDGSSDDTVVIAHGFGQAVRVLTQANAGPGSASTLGIRSVGADVVAMVDADDLWLPGKMRLQLDLLSADAGLAVVGCKMRLFRHGMPDDGKGEVRGGLLRSVMVMRREVCLDVGDIVDLPGKCGDIIDWVARLRERGHRTHEIDEVLALRRVIPGSLSHGRSQSLDHGYLKAAHLAMLRRRERAGGTPPTHP